MSAFTPLKGPWVTLAVPGGGPHMSTSSPIPVQSSLLLPTAHEATAVPLRLWWEPYGWGATTSQGTTLPRFGPIQPSIHQSILHWLCSQNTPSPPLTPPNPSTPHPSHGESPFNFCLGPSLQGTQYPALGEGQVLASWASHVPTLHLGIPHNNHVPRSIVSPPIHTSNQHFQIDAPKLLAMPTHQQGPNTCKSVSVEVSWTPASLGHPSS